MKPSLFTGLIKAALTSSKSKPILKLAIGLFWASGIALVVWLIYQYRLQLSEFLIRANYWHLLGFLFFYLISFCFSIMAWGSIMRAFSPEISFWMHLKIFSITLASRRLPGTIWYIGGRAVYYQTLGISLRSVSLASLLEMISWVISGFLLGVFLVPTILQWPTFVLSIFRLVALVGFFLYHPRLIDWTMKKLGHPLQQKLRYQDTLGWLALTAGGWLAGGGMIIELANSFMPTRMEDIGYILGAWAISGALGLLTIFLPSSFGVTEISLASMLSLRLPLALSISISLLTRILTISIEFLLSIFFYIFKKRMDNYSWPSRK